MMAASVCSYFSTSSLPAALKMKLPRQLPSSPNGTATKELTGCRHYGHIGQATCLQLVPDIRPSHLNEVFALRAQHNPMLPYVIHRPLCCRLVVLCYGARHQQQPTGNHPDFFSCQKICFEDS
jgi:hypothetical protein